MITQALVPIVGVFEQDQTAVGRKAAFSGEVERVSEVIEQVHGLVYPLETAPYGFAERTAFAFVTYDVPDCFPGAGCVDTCLCSGLMIQILHRLSGDKYMLDQLKDMDLSAMYRKYLNANLSDPALREELLDYFVDKIFIDDDGKLSFILKLRNKNGVELKPMTPDEIIDYSGFTRFDTFVNNSTIRAR